MIFGYNHAEGQTKTSEVISHTTYYVIFIEGDRISVCGAPF